MIKKMFSWITVILFLLLAALPLYGMLVPEWNTDTGENRALADFPSGSELSAGTLTEWFEDHFALRGSMIRIWNRLNVRSGVEIINGVAIGKDGWLYYMQDGSREDITRTIRFSSDERSRIYSSQQANADYLAEKGISYYLMICPDKHTVYPEYLPDGLTGYLGSSRFDGMAAALRQNTDVNFVDTREAVIAEKENHTVFLKTDTHWNGYGAFAAYEALMDAVRTDHPDARKLSEEECSPLISENWYGGDMASFIGKSGKLSDTYVAWEVKDSNAYEIFTPYPETCPDDPQRQIVRMINPDNPELPSAVVFRDSFCNQLQPLLSNSFSRVTFVWSTCVLDYIVEYEQPDIVIMEYVERYCGGAGNAADMSTLEEKEAAAAQVLSENWVEGLPKISSKIRFTVDSIEEKEQKWDISGWAFLSYRDSKRGEIQLVLRCGEDLVWIQTNPFSRPDVTSYFRSEVNRKLTWSGFYAVAQKEELHNGEWEVYIVIDDGEELRCCVPTGNRIVVNEQ